MTNHGIQSGYWVSVDAAYVCSESLLVTYYSVQIQNPEEGVWRDAFNFFQRSLRVHVKQAFGNMVSRFGIL